MPSLLFFTVAAAAMWSGLALLHGFGLPLLLPVTGVVVFCNSMARVWGVRAMAVGNVLTVVLALAVDRALPADEAAILFVAFLVGGAWAVVMTVFIWRIHPEREGSRMVAANWRLLALFARDLGRVMRPGPTVARPQRARPRRFRGPRPRPPPRPARRPGGDARGPAVGGPARRASPARSWPATCSPSRTRTASSAR